MQLAVVPHVPLSATLTVEALIPVKTTLPSALEDIVIWTALAHAPVALTMSRTKQVIAIVSFFILSHSPEQ